MSCRSAALGTLNCVVPSRGFAEVRLGEAWQDDRRLIAAPAHYLLILASALPGDLRLRSGTAKSIRETRRPDARIVARREGSIVQLDTEVARMDVCHYLTIVLLCAQVSAHQLVER
jgi:hypothetical protein